jgi:phosphatidylserine decarboxylase
LEIKYINRKTKKIHSESPPAEGLLKFLYDNPFGNTAILPLVKRKLISAFYGRIMDKPSSSEKIEKFVNKLGIDMSESQKNITEFKSFNDFFYRKLKTTARPIGKGFVSPGDGRLLAFENIMDLQNFFVKGRGFTLTEFLNDKETAKKHENDSLIILRLAPNDYHRYHFPIDGDVSKTKKIKGSYFSVSPYALAGNFTKVFCENKREYVTLFSKEKGEIILAPVGATMVGSIFESFTPNTSVKKGDEMGYFAFGGSTIVILVDKTKIKIDTDLLENTKNKMESYVKMGETIGQ